MMAEEYICQHLLLPLPISIFLSQYLSFGELNIFSEKQIIIYVAILLPTDTNRHTWTPPNPLGPK